MMNFIKRPRAVSAKSLLNNEQGSTAIEFAVVLPIFLMFMIGTFEMGYYLYAKTQLEGAMAKASRDSSLESNIGSGAAVIDQRVMALAGHINGTAEFTFNREAYSNFNTATRWEPFTDTNGNGQCGTGEPYEDINNSGTRDRGGKVGQGGAKDVVVYTVEMTYDRLFPVEGFFGWDPEVTLIATTLVQNQPYASQDAENIIIRNCA